ncbi:MAG TPA: penicillin-binding protein 2, partial [Caulobacteraceae bacterium]|nr:penicillin-binding protein 2 [Caulobacteraceae bacterium]
MTEPAIFFNDVNQRQSVFNRRIFVMGGVAGAGLTALGVRLAQLQIIDNSRYKSLSASNQYNYRLVVPPRGRILDRNGVELASNRPNFRLLLLRDEDQDVDATLDSAAALIPISDVHRRQLVRQVDEGPRFVPVVIADDLTWEEFSRINVRKPELPGLEADMAEARFYPFAGAFAHVIGYVAKVTDTELKAAGPTPDPLMLNPGFRIGKQGVEKSLDLQLRGKPGGQKVEVDSRGKVVREDPAGDIKPTPGEDVVLTLDADIQNRALEVFGEESGAAVMMDCRTGDILCLASAPSFDPN